MPSAFRPMLLRGISAVSSALTTIWPPRSPCRSRLHDELVHSAQKIGGRVCVLRICARGSTAPCSKRMCGSRATPHNLAASQGQPRTIQQEHSARDFLSRQGLKSAGILCVFQTFRTAESAKNIRRRPKRNYAVLPYITALLHRRRWTRSGRPWAVPSAPATWAFPSGFPSGFPSAPSAPPWGAPSPRRAWRPDGCASRSSSG